MAMSISITCPSCGHPLQVNGTDRGKDVECLLCGAVCHVPISAADSGVGKRSLKDPAASNRREVEAPKRKALYFCLHCGKKSQVPAGSNGRTRICPYCGLSEIEPEIEDELPPSAPGRRDTPRPGRHPPADEDSNAYAVVTPSQRPCPNCGHVLHPEVKLCGACGYNLRTGKKPKKADEPLRRTWETGLPLPRRVLLALMGLAVIWLVFGLGAFLILEFASAFLTPWLIFTFLLVLAVGSYPRVDLERNPIGEVTLTKTWRVCFLVLAPTQHKLFDFEGVATGMVRETDFWDWLPLVVLLPFGILPGVWWWLRLMSQDMHFVALARDHGYPAVMLYRGWNRALAQDLARTLRDVGGW